MHNRREALRILGAAAAASVVEPHLWLPAPLEAASWPPGALGACIVTPQQTEGPYFVDKKLRRSDLRHDTSTGALMAGVPLTLAINVAQITGADCRPLEGAVVDVWQCDAGGEYSDVSDRRLGFNTRGRDFLRGYQLTSKDGRVEFTTIYPGWYPGRAVHIHFKVRTSAASGRAGEFTSQWYFDEGVTDAVFAAGPYAEHRGQRTRNERDGIYRRGGNELMLAINKAGAGYAATFDVGLRL